MIRSRDILPERKGLESLRAVSYIVKIILVCCWLACGTLSSFAGELRALLITHLRPGEVDTSKVAARVGGLLKLHGFTWKAVNYKDYSYEKYRDKFALYVVCGSSITIPKSALVEEFRLMKESSKSVIGICYGFQQMIRAFGGTLSKLPEKTYLLPEKLFSDVARYTFINKLPLIRYC